MGQQIRPARTLSRRESASQGSREIRGAAGAPWWPHGATKPLPQQNTGKISKINRPHSLPHANTKAHLLSELDHLQNSVRSQRENQYESLQGVYNQVRDPQHIRNLNNNMYTVERFPFHEALSCVKSLLISQISQVYPILWRKKLRPHLLALVLCPFLSTRAACLQAQYSIPFGKNSFAP